MEDNRQQLNVRIDEEMMNNLKKYVEIFNKEHFMNLTVSGLVKSIIKQFFEKLH